MIMTSSAALPAEDIQRPLSESFATATRSVHAKLNKLIIARLPLAIPPRAADPSIYVSGLLHIAPIYVTFESLWKAIAESPQPVASSTQGDGCQLGSSLLASGGLPSVSNVGHSLKYQAALCERTRSILTSLYLPELMRSDRLRSDIGSLTGWSAQVVEEQLKAVSDSGRLADFTQHARRTIEKKPHVLLAYSYILFMALFAGGRFIRATLESAGSEFWAQVPSPIPPSQTRCQAREPSSAMPASAATGPVDLMRGDHRTIGVGTKHSRHSLPLSFFHFATVLDGEDLKKEFKKRLSESESLLTPQERHDIIQEAVCIFDNMLLLVGQLDNVCETNPEDGQSIMPSWQSFVPGGRLRDSLAVARERKREKTAPKWPEGSEMSDSCLFRHAIQEASETAETQDMSDVEKQHPACCPASKSMRFAPKLPVPDRKEHSQTLSANGAANVVASSQWLLSRSAMSLISNIIIVAGVVAVFSMVFLARRSADEGLTVEKVR